MNKIQKTLVITLSAGILSLVGLSAFAEEAGTSTAILDPNWKIEDILNMILVVLNAGAAVLATGSIAFAGFLYMTARNNASQVQKAKTMIFNTVIGLICYIFMWTLLEWLIPGGVM